LPPPRVLRIKALGFKDKIKLKKIGISPSKVFLGPVS
jgi:hypothetical protein